MSKKIRLAELHLHNYRCFESLDMDFDEKLTVLVARNGGGKTAVLDAIVAAFGPFIKTLNSAAGGGVIRREDVRLSQHPGRALKEMEPQYPVVLKAMGLLDGQEFDWTRELATAKSHTKYAEDWVLRDYAQELRLRVQGHEPIILPVIAYYGTGRLWGRRGLSRGEKAESTSRLRGYKDCLDPSSSYRDFEVWFRKMHLVVLEEGEGRSPASEEAVGQLAGVRHAVNRGLAVTAWGGLRYRHAAGGIVASHPNHGELPVHLLSDGLRNMIGVVADIAYRMVSLNPHLGEQAAQQTSGIVLIDEVDMHLHPEWQQVVLESLKNAFPSVQFIVTTHSPQVLTTVQRKNIRLLEERDGQITAAAPLQDPYARESGVALEDVMSVRARPPVGPAQALEEYRTRVEKGEIDSARALELRRELEGEFGAGAEELQLADLVIAKWKALRHGKAGKQ
jgi:predicted ATP-binding protein involved in virulence